MPTELEALVERLRLGRDTEEAFRHLFRRYYRVVLRYFAERRLAPDVCENLAQETFLAVHEGIAGYRGDGSFEAWLFGIARRLLAQELRRRVRQRWDGRAAGELAGSPATAGPLERALGHELQQSLAQALGDLPEQMRHCAELRLVHELKYREIAERLDISVDAVRVQLARARRRLRRSLGEALRPEAF